MIRVLHIITGLSTGGAEMMLYKLLSATDRSLFQPTVISLIDKGTLGERIEALGIEVRCIGMRPGIPSPMALLRLRSEIGRIQPNLVQGWMYHANLMGLWACGTIRQQIPVVWNIRQSLYSLGYEKRGTAAVIRLGGLCSCLTAGIVYNSATSAGQHEALGFHNEKAVIIPNGFDSDVFAPSSEARTSLRKELGVPPTALLIGLIGRYHPMKDHATFLQAAEILGRRYKELHFVLAGKDINMSNEDLSGMIGVDMRPRIHCLGERIDIPRITAALDIAASSSYAEGFANVLGEAMSCGVPCVTTDVGDSASIVADTGRIVAPRSPGALAAAWGELIEMGSEDRNKLGLAARQRIIHHFSLETVVKRYEYIYSEHSFHGMKGE